MKIIISTPKKSEVRTKRALTFPHALTLPHALTFARPHLPYSPKPSHALISRPQISLRHHARPRLPLISLGFL